MGFKEFNKNYGQLILSLVFFIDFSITYSLWILSSAILNDIDKLKHIITLVAFTGIPMGSQLLICLLKLWKKNIPESKSLESVLERTTNFTDIYTYVYNFVVFSMARIIDFFEYNEFSYFLSELITGICSAIFLTFVSIIVLRGKKKAYLVSSVITINAIMILSIIWGRPSYPAPLNLANLIISAVIALPITILIVVSLTRKYRKK